MVRKGVKGFVFKGSFPFSKLAGCGNANLSNSSLRKVFRDRVSTLIKSYGKPCGNLPGVEVCRYTGYMEQGDCFPEKSGQAVAGSSI